MSAAARLAKPAKNFPLVSQLKSLNSKQVDNGIYLASVEDAQSPISSLSLVLSTGTREQKQDQIGAANWLKFSIFKSTNSSSTIKLTRESDILGHSVSSFLTRENLFLTVNFNRSDLPHVVEEFSEIVSGLLSRDNEPSGIYTREFVRKSNEWNIAMKQAAQDAMSKSHSNKVFDNLFAVAFRSGLANPLYPSHFSALTIEKCLEFISGNVGADRVKLVGYGVDFDDLSNAASHFFSQPLPQVHGAGVKSESKYFGGEHFSLDYSPVVSYALAFNAPSVQHSDHVTALVLKNLFGTNNAAAIKYGQSHSIAGTLKSQAQVDSFSLAFSDAGLFGFYLESQSVEQVNHAASNLVKSLKELSNGSIKNLGSALAATKYELASQIELASREDKLMNFNQQLMNKKLYSTAELLALVDTVDETKVQNLVKKMLKTKPSVSCIGAHSNVYRIDQLGL